MHALTKRWGREKAMKTDGRKSRLGMEMDSRNRSNGSGQNGGEENQWKRGKLRKWTPVLLILAAVLAAEILVCNFSAWKSLFYGNRVVFENVEIGGGTAIEGSPGEYWVEEGIFTIHISQVDMDVHNLFFAFDFSKNEPVSYTVTLTDDGNAYPYSLPERVLMPGNRKSLYTNLYPSGKVGEIGVQFAVPAGSVVTVNGVCANARIPFVFSIGRVLVMLGAALLLYGTVCREEWQGRSAQGHRESAAAGMCTGSRGQRAITMVVIFLLIGMAWKLAHVNPICVASPWPHHKQYQELAEAMEKGHVFLEHEPSEGLLNAPNPYDTIYLQANGIDYRADYAYYEGKYYVYFGVVPELLLYLPYYLLTGEHMFNYVAVFLFYSGFILAVFALYWEIIKRWFAKVPFLAYLLVSALTVCGGNYLFIIARPDLYDTPIMAANMFTVAGIWLWIKGKYTLQVKGRRVCYFLGSLCMALVAGCRPQMLLFSFLAIPLFWDEVIRTRELFGKKNLWDTLCICLPYVLIAAGVMFYNGIRFSSPFDFGATYSLTSNDMTKRSFNMHQALLGLWHYFLRPPVVESGFPYLQGVQIESGSYMGKLNAEYTYGGLLAGNAFLWVLLCVGKAKEKLKGKGLYALVWVSAAVSVILGLVDVTGAGILQRYMVDMVWGIWFGAVLTWFAMMENGKEKGWLRTVMVCLAVVCLLQAVYGFGVVLGNGDLSVNVRGNNPELYYYLEGLLRF